MRAWQAADSERAWHGALLLLVALLLKVSVPSGWMWSGEGFGWKPCPSVGGAAAVASDHHEQHGSQDQEHGTAPEQPCVFAAVPMLAAGDLSVEPATPLLASAAPFSTMSSPGRRSPPAAAPPPATGPLVIV